MNLALAGNGKALALAGNDKASISAVGAGESWRTVQESAARSFNQFVEWNDAEPGGVKIGHDFENLDVKSLCDRALYQRFAHFLVNVYTKPEGT